MLIILALVLWNWLWLTPLLAYILLLFGDALRATHSLPIALLALPVGFTQLIGYGVGFLQSYIEKVILKKGLENAEYLKKHYK